MNEHHPKTVTIVRDKEHFANIKMSSAYCTTGGCTERAYSAPLNKTARETLVSFFAAVWCILGIILNRLQSGEFLHVLCYNGRLVVYDL